MPLLKEDIEAHQDNLTSLKADTTDLDQGKEIPVEELFSKSFMEKYTSSSSFRSFVEESPSTLDNFESFQISEFDAHVSENSVFDSWDEMKRKAAEEWVVEQIDI